MKIGDYVRFKNGEIEKIHSFARKDNPLFNVLINARYHNTNEIMKYGELIDLIKVGDIITFKDDNDVYRVCGVPNKECALEVFYLEKKYDGETEDIMVEVEEMKKYIKSIVTKEQFESMEYKVGE